MRRLAGAALLAFALACSRAEELPHATRLLDAPIVTGEMLPGRDGANVNGPSLIRVPDWVPGRLGRYYLYFAHHRGTYIRLAVADSPAGPWKLHEGGVLRVDQTACDHQDGILVPAHIGSPDVHVDAEAREIRMYFHCPARFAAEQPRQRRRQTSFVARSPDGLNFTAGAEPLGRPYLRAFRRGDAWYALANDGYVYRSADGLGGFERGGQLLERRVRHVAVAPDGDALRVFFSRIGDAPERILFARVDLRGDWMRWSAGPETPVLEPERSWEGGELPIERSRPGSVSQPVRQLRDPAFFEDGGASYLLYSVAGERGIGIAKLDWK
jgi:hypothetical protein